MYRRPTPPPADHRTEVALPGGARLFLKPWSSAVSRAGQLAYVAAVRDGGEQAEADVAYTIGAAAFAATDWEGVGEPSPDHPDQLIAAPFDKQALVETLTLDDQAYLAVDRQYIVPGMLREQEKNESAPSLAGGSPAGAKTESSPAPGADATTAPPVLGNATTAPSSDTPADPTTD